MTAGVETLEYSEEKIYQTVATACLSYFQKVNTKDLDANEPRSEESRFSTATFPQFAALCWPRIYKLGAGDNMPDHLQSLYKRTMLSPDPSSALYSWMREYNSIPRVLHGNETKMLSGPLSYTDHLTSWREGSDGIQKRSSDRILVASAFGMEDVLRAASESELHDAFTADGKTCLYVAMSYDQKFAAALLHDRGVRDRRCGRPDESELENERRGTLETNA